MRDDRGIKLVGREEKTVNLSTKYTVTQNTVSERTIDTTGRKGEQS